MNSHVNKHLTICLSMKIDTNKNNWVRVMVFNATFYNISVILWRLALLVEKTRVPGENHKPVVSH